MKVLRQLICAVLICGLSCVITGCGKASVESSEPTTEITTETLADRENEIEGKIVVWVESSALMNTKYAEYKKEFEAKYPGTEVEYKVVSNFEIAGYNSILNGDAGDVVMIPNRMTEDEIKEYFIPFGTTEDISKKYREQYIHRMDYDGVVYGLPEYVMPQGIVYNKRVLEYAGVVELPTTPDEFIDMLTAIKVKNQGIIPFYIDDTALDKWQDHVWGSVSGNADYHYNGIVLENDPFAKDSPNYVVHKLMYDIVYDRLCQSKKLDYTHARQLLNRGDIACMLVDFEDVAKIQDAGSNPDDIGYMPFPYNIDGKQYATATYGYCYGIPLDSLNKSTAEAFVKFMIKDSGYASSEGAISLKKKTARPTLLSDFEGVELVFDNPATTENEGLYQQLCEKSGLQLEDGKQKREIIEVAMKARPGQAVDEEEDTSTEEEEEVILPKDFDEIMEQWYQKWNAVK